MGLGQCIKKLTAEKIASVITTVITDDKIKERARLIGESIRSENGTREAVNAFYRDLPRAWETMSEVIKYNEDKSRGGGFLSKITGKSGVSIASPSMTNK